MEEEQKHFFLLSMIIFAICFLLTLRILPNIIFWNLSISNSLLDLLGFLWVVMGVSVAFEFLRKQRDKWGTGGMLFHIFIYYSAFYYSILTVLSIINFSIELPFLILFFNTLAITLLGWLGFILYYD